MNKRWSIVLFCLLALIVAPSQAQQTSGEEITAQGIGLAANKDEALLGAKRDAIEKGIGMILLSQTEIQNFMVQRDIVITKTVGAVKSYELVSETRTSDNLWEVKINAVLSRSAMREDLASFKILLESMDKPRVIVVIAENNVGNQDPTNQAAETAIIQFLRDPYEFDIVDPQMVARLKESTGDLAGFAGDASLASAAGKKYGADVIITGTAVAREASGMSQNLGGMVSVQADVTFKAINCTTGRVFGTSSAHAAKVHISPNTAGTQAIAKASDTAIKSLLDILIKNWQGQLNNGLTITASVKNVGTFRVKNSLLQTLGGFPGVSAVRERSWNDQTSVLELDIEYKGTVNGFCGKADGYKISNAGGAISVSGVNGLAVMLALQTM